MKKILVLGAGFVAKPLVKYLSGRGYHIMVADILMEKAEEIVKDFPSAEAVQIFASENGILTKLIADSDLIVSFLPPPLHPRIAEICIAHKTDMVTASYVSPEMRRLEKSAVEAGVTIINEVGVDPGIDHMSAMRIIDDVRSRGGVVTNFKSYCGGLPAPEASDNPFGYKFSWNPKGVLSAGKSPAHYLENGVEIKIPGKELFSNYWILDIPGVGKLETYPNRDTLSYKELYTLNHVESMFRGTLRNLGWCDALKAITDLGYLGEESHDWKGNKYSDLSRSLIGCNSGVDLRSAAAEKLGLSDDPPPLDKLEWLGLFGDDKIPLQKGSPLDILVERMLSRMGYRQDERDMLIMFHRFKAKFKDGHGEEITSRLLDFGVPGGESSMSRTVGYPAAIASRLVLEGEFTKPGIHIPVIPELYVPILKELETLGIRCEEEMVG